MQALTCATLGPIASLTLGEQPRPEPRAGEILVEVRAASLNYPDALIVQGLYQVKPPLPFSPGAEYAGDVAAVGEGVTAFKVGDKVMVTSTHGGLAQFACVEAARALPLPEGVDYVTGAALVLTYCTSLHALADVGALARGETLLVLGAAGGVGIAAIEIAKLMGARVIAAAHDDAKLALCREHGADETIAYGSESLRDRIDALTEKRGVDVVYDPIGGAHSETAMRALSWGGRLLVVGFASGEIPKLALNLALLKERQIRGVYWGDWARRNPAAQQAHLTQLVAWLRAGKIRPPVTETLPLSRAVDALTRLASRGVRGKVVVLPNG
jgi:NADPH:quinone reductase